MEVESRRSRPSPVTFAVGFLGVAAYVLLRAGVGVYPGIGVALDITNRLPSMPAFPPLAQSFQHAPLGPAMARLLGATTSARFQTLHVGVLVAGTAALGS